jgi:16S rRNA C1402 (ribose-2'-O) methylase RsmI
MDTPYRLSRLMSELAERWPERRALIGCDFTSPQERILEAKLKDLRPMLGEAKAEFILVVFPAATSAAATDKDTPSRPRPTNTSLGSGAGGGGAGANTGAGRHHRPKNRR